PPTLERTPFGPVSHHSFLAPFGELAPFGVRAFTRPLPGRNVITWKAFDQVTREPGKGSSWVCFRRLAPSTSSAPRRPSIAALPYHTAPFQFRTGTRFFSTRPRSVFTRTVTRALPMWPSR